MTTAAKLTVGQTNTLSTVSIKSWRSISAVPPRELIWSHLCQQSSIQLTLKSRVGLKCCSYQLLFKLPLSKWPKFADKSEMTELSQTLSSAPWPLNSKDIKASVTNNLVSVFILRPSKIQQIMAKPAVFTLHYTETSEAQQALTFRAVVSIFHAFITWLFPGLSAISVSPESSASFRSSCRNSLQICECRFVPCLLPPSTAFCEARSLKEQKNRARWKRRREEGWQLYSTVKLQHCNLRTCKQKML